jgi:hypothetical protein
VTIVATGVLLALAVNSNLYPENDQQKRLLTAAIAFGATVFSFLFIQTLLVAGSRVSSTSLFSREIPLGSLFDLGNVGQMELETITRAELWAVRGMMILNVWDRRNHWAAFNSRERPREFDLAIGWLESRGVPIEGKGDTTLGAP